MIINKITNANRECYQIFDEDNNEYLIDAGTEELAKVKYEAIKYLEANPPAPSYIELRKKEYPSIPDQLDMQYWDIINGTTIWKDKIAEIKNRYPKTETK